MRYVQSASRTRRSTSLGVTLFLCLASLAAGTDAVLGPNGELYRVQAGFYGELFPDGSAADRETPVLALSVMRPGGESERWLVPSTEGDEVERNPSLVLERRSQSVFLVWESNFNFVNSGVNLVAFDDSKSAPWSEVIEVSGDPFSHKTAPQIAITRDSYTLPNSSGGLDTFERMILHTLWWEESGVGARVVHAPLVLINGQYMGLNPIYVLNDFDTGGAPVQGTVISEDLLLSPALHPGRNTETVVAALANPETGHLVTLELRVLPGELSHLAGEVRAQIIDIGAHACAPGTGAGQQGTVVLSLANQIWSYMTYIGHRFHSGVLSYLAGEVRAQIIDIGARACDGPTELQSLAEAIHGNILTSGAEVMDSGLKNLSDPVRAQIIDIGAFSQGNSPRSENLQIRVASQRPVPETGNGPTRVYASRDGKEVVICWETPGELFYRESRGAGWSAVFSLEINETLTLEQAHQIVRDRLQGR